MAARHIRSSPPGRRAVGNIDLRGATAGRRRRRACRPRRRRSRRASAARRASRRCSTAYELRPVTGLPPLAALRGTLAFADGHLQRSTLTGQWLGGPVASGSVSGARAPAATASRSAATAFSDAAGAAGRHRRGGGCAELTGTTEWSAAERRAGGGRRRTARWQLRADSTLVGLASQLPEPLAKAPRRRCRCTWSCRARRRRAAAPGLGERLQRGGSLARSGDSGASSAARCGWQPSAPAAAARARDRALDGRVAGSISRSARLPGARGSAEPRLAGAAAAACAPVRRAAARRSALTRR